MAFVLLTSVEDVIFSQDRIDSGKASIGLALEH